MARGGAEQSAGVRKRHRANSMGLQWWRKLTLPRRGKKHSLLAPQPLTQSQEELLLARRAALQKAVIAPRAARVKHIAVAEWDSHKRLARVVSTRGNSMQSMGIFVEGVQYLYPEEAAFLVDKGTLNLLIENLPASFQRTWAVSMSAINAVSLEEYLTFTHLRRAGYVVRRFEGEKGCLPPGITLSFSAWRVGSFKRKEATRPLFHVAVFRYDQPLPLLSSVAQYMEGCEKCRVKIAVIDRGVVVITDVATNATPLSERFIRRLADGEQEVARGMRDGQAGVLFPSSGEENGL